MPHEGKADTMDAVMWYRVPLILGAVSILLIVLSITIIIKTYQVQEPIEFSSDVTKKDRSESSEQLIVDIRGAVATPGVYELPIGVRVEDALIRAGGLTHDADLVRMEQTMNRAAILSDGAKLYVPRMNEQPLPEDATVEKVESGINLNSASSSELEALPGVGPVTATKIIAGRPYQRLEELTERNIIGQSLFTKIQAFLTL